MAHYPPEFSKKHWLHRMWFSCINQLKWGNTSCFVTGYIISISDPRQCFRPAVPIIECQGPHLIHELILPLNQSLRGSMHWGSHSMFHPCQLTQLLHIPSKTWLAKWVPLSLGIVVGGPNLRNLSLNTTSDVIFALSFSLGSSSRYRNKKSCICIQGRGLCTCTRPRFYKLYNRGPKNQYKS